MQMRVVFRYGTVIVKGRAIMERPITSLSTA
jgi:hypothetical protein